MSSSYFVPKEQMEKFIADGTMGDQEGVYFSYVTDPDAVRAILPPMFEVVSPVVTVYVINMGKPAFTAQYNEASLMLQAKYGDVVGTYFVSLMLTGRGGEMGMSAGRDVFGLPKKLCSAIDIQREGDDVKIRVVRHEHVLLDLGLKIGPCNDEIGIKIYGDITPGFEREGKSFVFRYSPVVTEDNVVVKNITLDLFKSKTIYHRWETASIEHIELGGGEFDPWDSLPVVKPLGAGYGVNDNLFLGSETLAELDGDEVFPYIFKGFYDMGTIAGRGDQNLSQVVYA